MLDKLNDIADKPGVVTGILGLLGLGLTIVSGAFGRRDMANCINAEFDKQKNLLNK